MRLLELEKFHERVIAQDEAIEAVAKAVRGSSWTERSYQAHWFFHLPGPTGVGKTELARALASALFGDDDAMILLTCRSTWSAMRCRA